MHAALSVENMSIITVIPWIFGFIGLALGGFVSDFFYKKFAQKGVLFSRKLVLVTCLFLSAVMYRFCWTCIHDSQCSNACSTFRLLPIFDWCHLLGNRQRCRQTLVMLVLLEVLCISWQIQQESSDRR